MSKTTIKNRPPIVTVMGHVDHGKTTLLDKIRQSNTALKEAGQITQHISAYQAEVKTKSGKSLITFIDTPGHAAFAKMRQRGAKVTDIVVLVISAQDGIMTQTKECINIIQENNLNFIVAATKIDLPNSSLEKVKGQLVELGLTPEDYGGQVPVIPVSAKTGEGIDKLLETILLHAEVMELKDSSNLPMEAVVIESRMDPRRGALATVVITQGILNLGDSLYTQTTQGKAKAIFDFLQKPIKTASVSTPVEILGLFDVPAFGSLLTTAPQTLEKNIINQVLPQLTSEDAIKLKVILKADTQGTLEALINSFSEEVKVISASIGAPTDNDIFLASTTNSAIYAFNVKTSPFIQKLAENSKVTLVESKIIYEIIENIQQQVLKLMEPTIDETILGEGAVIAEFKIEKVRIAGVKITKGEIKKGDLIHLTREGKIIKDTKIGGIREGKAVVESIKTPKECGMTFLPYVDFKVGDGIISYKK